MFTIQKTFENDYTSIFAVEGSITDEALDTWTMELGSLLNGASGHIILNFVSTQYISSRAARILNLMISDRVMLMNEPNTIRQLRTCVGRDQQWIN